MKPHAGKLVVTGVAALILAPIVLYLEFQHGIWQKFQFERQTKAYLAATYDEEMTVAGVRYLWDNIEPLVATAYPASDPSLRFYVNKNENRESGFSDNYATTLWMRQAEEEAETILAEVVPEYARSATIDFTCCDVADYDFESIRGVVPHVGTTRLPFDLAVELERPMLAADLESMYRSAAALRESDSLVLGNLAFRFPLPATGGTVRFELPGEAVRTVASAAEMEAYNATRLPARQLAERIDASLEWNKETNEALFTRDGKTLVVRSWGDEAVLNGTPFKIEVDVYIGESSELLVPVRIVERAFGRKIVLW